MQPVLREDMLKRMDNLFPREVFRRDEEARRRRCRYNLEARKRPGIIAA